MHYYLYEIKNTVNGKIYVGVHKTKSLDDGYMGSGKVVSNAIRKYGIEHFTKTILETFDNSKDMFAREKEVVTDEFLARNDVYNLRRGGTGGFDYINKILTPAQRTKAGKAGFYANKHLWSEEICKKWKDASRKTFKQLRTVWKGDQAMEELYRKSRTKGCEQAALPASQEKKKETYKKIAHQQGSANSQFGKMWITDGKESLSVNKTLPIPEGWRKGRVI